MIHEQIVLASASPRRRELMEQIGIHPEIIPSQVEEVVTSSNPEQVVMELAGQKAREVADRLGDNRIVVVPTPWWPWTARFWESRPVRRKPAP